MQQGDPLNEDWTRVCNAVSADGPSLVNAMLHVADACAAALRALPRKRWTVYEKQVLEEILLSYDRGVARVNEFLNDKPSDYQSLADTSVQCWDYIVPEYDNHQLAHMTSLVAAQIVSTQPQYHSRTWLFRMTGPERWALFLGLAQQLKVLQPNQIQDLATRLAS